MNYIVLLTLVCAIGSPSAAAVSPLFSEGEIQGNSVVLYCDPKIERC